jgi:hypothetical protein
MCLSGFPQLYPFSICSCKFRPQWGEIPGINRYEPCRNFCPLPENLSIEVQVHVPHLGEVRPEGEGLSAGVLSVVAGGGGAAGVWGGAWAECGQPCHRRFGERHTPCGGYSSGVQPRTSPCRNRASQCAPSRQPACCACGRGGEKARGLYSPLRQPSGRRD